MIKIQRNALPANYSDTKSLQTWGQIVGNKPEVLSPVSLMKPEYSILFHTLGLGNIFSDGKSFEGLKGAKSISSHFYEWQIKSTDQYVYEIAEDCTADGFNQATFTVVFTKKAYEMGDTIMLKNRQQLKVVAPVVKRQHDRWEYTVKLNTDSYADRIRDTNALKKGALTSFISNYDHEGSSKGRPVGDQQSYELHTNYVSTYRVTETWTGDFLRQKADFYRINKGTKDTSGRDQALYFQMMDSEKKAAEKLLEMMNNDFIFGETNMDAFGNSLDMSVEGYSIIKGQGLIQQIEKVCPKHAYAGKLTTRTLKEAIATLAEKTGKYGGGMEITFICNQKMWVEVQDLLMSDIQNANVTNDFYFSYTKKDGTGAKVPAKGVGQAIGNPDLLMTGATFRAYNWAGYVVKFVVDASLSTNIGYKDRPYGIFLNTGLLDDGQPNVVLYSIKGTELIVGDQKGFGGMTGTSSGEFSTPFYGARRDWLSKGSLCVRVPYHAFILEKQREA